MVSADTIPGLFACQIQGWRTQRILYVDHMLWLSPAIEAKQHIEQHLINAAEQTRDYDMTKMHQHT